MADTYIPGQEFRSWTSLPGQSGGLGAVGALYLAHKAGLIDLDNKDQLKSLQKNGVIGHSAMKALKGAAKPPSESNAPVMPKTLSSTENPEVTVGGPMNQDLPKGVPLEPMSLYKGGDLTTSMLDHELIDSSLPNFAALFV